MLKTASNYYNAIGALVFKGAWNASTNTPTLTSGVGDKGDYYVVSVAGNTNLDGITDWQLGDWAIFNGSVWQKVDNTDLVISVNGQTGAVNLTAVDVGATPNTAYVIAGNNLDGGGQLTGNVTIDLNSLPAANVTGLGTMAFQNANSVMITGGYATGLTNVETNFVQLDVAAGESADIGKIYWDNGDGVPAVGLKGGLVTLQIGTQEYARVFNDSGTTLTKGQAVYISGAQGNRVAVKLAQANAEATSFGTIGLVAETMLNGAEGFIIVSGALYKLNTQGLVAGATVYLSPTTPGAVTTTKPQAPDQLVVVGWVERVDNIVGSIYVKVDNGYEIDELHDVRITTPVANNSALIYSTVLNVWENKNPADTRTALGLGTIATQDANNVAITGGTLANVIITSSTVNSSNINAPAISGGTYANANITSVASTFPNNYLTNSSATIGTTVVSLGSTVTTLDGVTLANATISSGNATFNNVSAANVTITANLNANLTTNANATFVTSSLPLVPEGYLIININGSAKKIPYYGV